MFILLQQQWGDACWLSLCLIPHAGAAFKLFILAKSCQGIHNRKHWHVQRTSERAYIFLSWTQEQWQIFNTHKHPILKSGRSHPGFVDQIMCCCCCCWTHDTSETLLTIGEHRNHFKMCSAVWGILRMLILTCTLLHLIHLFKCFSSFDTYFIFQQCVFNLVILKTLSDPLTFCSW